MNNAEKIRYLTNKDTRCLLSQLQVEIQKHDFSTRLPPVIESFSASRRIALLEQLELRQKAQIKFSYADKLLYTRLGLQQATQEVVGRYKAGRIGSQYSCATDLCCGLGGDSFHLQCPVIGVEKDEAAVRLYQHNMGVLGRPHLAVKADVNQLLPESDCALIDPARRKGLGEGHWDESKLSPGLPSIQNMMNKYRAMCIKLAPGMHLQEPFTLGEMEYIGLKDQCLELCVWYGEMASREGLVRATELPSGVTVALPLHEIPYTFDTFDKPGEYLYEPVKALVRSHLFAYFGQRNNLWQIDPNIAYLSGNERVDSPFLKAFKILDVFPFNLKSIQKCLQAHNIGYVTVKKRGVRETPEFIQRKLKLKGHLQATLVATRLMGQKSVIWVSPL